MVIPVHVGQTDYYLDEHVMNNISLVPALSLEICQNIENH